MAYQGIKRLFAMMCNLYLMAGALSIFRAKGKAVVWLCAALLLLMPAEKGKADEQGGACEKAVSYTHLTLPTKA